MDSDIDIARAANPMHIENIANQLGLSRSDLIMHGPNVAKVSWNSLKNKSKNEKIHNIENIILPIMENANLPMVPLNVKLKVDTGYGDNWAEAH